MSSWHAAYETIVAIEYLNSLSVAPREAMWREAISRGPPQTKQKSGPSISHRLTGHAVSVALRLSPPTSKPQISHAAAVTWQVIERIQPIEMVNP